MTEENIKLFDSELKVMDVLWKDGDKLFAALLGRKKLSMEQIKNLKQIVSELE